MTRSVACFAIICCLLFREAQAKEISAPAEFASVRAYIEQGIRDGLAPSVAVAVVKGDKVIWAEGFGYADLERKIRATADSIYILASVSKPITATGLMILKDQGLIDLDAPVNKYLPATKLRAFVGSAEEMTVRRLANHTSGLPLHYSFFYHGVPAPSMDETIRRYGFAATRPGSEWNYSNLGFGVLNYLVEVLSRTPWSKFMEEKLYDRLGMSRTSDHVRKGHVSGAASMYTVDVNGKFRRVSTYTFDHPGASIVHSTANDLARFARMHLNGGVLDGVRILQESTAREMRVMTGKRTEVSGTGIGWGVGDFYGRPCFSHSGGMPGVATWVRAFPEDGVATIVLTNADRRTMADEVSKQLAAVLFPQGKPPAETQQDTPDNNASGFIGVWKGKLVHFDGDIDLTLEIKDKDTVNIKFGSLSRQAREITFDKERFSGRIEAGIPTQATFHGIPTIDFRLRRSGDSLTGTGVALATGYFALSHWVELARSK